MYFPAIVLWRLCNRYQITLHERSHRTTALVSIDNAGQQYAPVPRITALGFSDGAGLRVKKEPPAQSAEGTAISYRSSSLSMRSRPL